jgi:uncharacterized membrane protein
MILLGLGVLLFAASHLVLAVPSANDALRQRFGQFYRPGLGLLSLIPLVLIVLGWRMSPFIAVYEPPSWGRIATFVLVLLAFLCLGIFLFRGSLRQRLRFPLASAVIFWSLGHLFANGDLASLVLFGGMLAYALTHWALGLANGTRPSAIVRQGHDVVSILISIALYGAVAQAHPLLTGVPVITLPS